MLPIVPVAIVLVSEEGKDYCSVGVDWRKLSIQADGIGVILEGRLVLAQATVDVTPVKMSLDQLGV